MMPFKILLLAGMYLLVIYLLLMMAKWLIDEKLRVR